MAEIGQILGGRYRLIELLGQGGMATIYRATDTGLGRDVALKLLRPEYLRDPDFSSRFRQEAQAAASLSHPNVVTVFDYGEDPSGPFIAMELVDGEDLASIVKRSGALPPRQAARIVAGVGRALGAAHAKGIVHRDVKPGNVLIGRDGRVKVVDFGIARAVAEAQMTLPGTTLGSVHYFSPEQARGEPTTQASDIYSLGIVLFELLTGVRPWTGDTAASVALARLSGPVPDPRTVRSSLPPDVAAIARKALSPAPEDRFSSAGAMADALEATLGSATGTDAPAAAVSKAPVPTGPAPTGVGAARAGAAGAADAAGAGAAAAAAIAGSGATGGPATPGPPSGASPAVISGTARSNPVRVPYPPEAYAGEDAEEPFSSAPHQRPARFGSARRGRYDEDELDGGGGTSPLVWLTGIIAIGLLAAVAFVVFQLASGGGPRGSAPPDTVTVPNFVGDTLASATSEAESLGIQLSVANATSTSPAGTILDQDPGAGKVIQPNGLVKVTVAVAAETTLVPDLRLQSLGDAATILFAAGLRPGTTTQAFDPIVPEGFVATQDPPALTPVQKDSVVNLVISKGPEPSPTPSPSPTPEPTPTPPPPEPTPAPPPEPTPSPIELPTPTPEPTPVLEATPPPP